MFYFYWLLFFDIFNFQLALQKAEKEKEDSSVEKKDPSKETKTEKKESTKDTKTEKNETSK